MTSAKAQRRAIRWRQALRRDAATTQAGRERLGNINGAEQAYRETLRLVETPEVYDRLGAMRALRKDYAGAIRFFRQAIGLRPDYSDAWLHLLNAYASSGDKKALLQETDRMARLFAQRHWTVEGLSTYAQ